MASLSCWGEVTTENEQDVVAANRKLHPQQVELLSVLTDIMTSAKTEYWIDQGTLLGAYRHGKFIERDSDTDIAVKNKEQFEDLYELLKSKLPNIYGSERKGNHCKGYRIWLKTGGTFKGTFNGGKIQWPLVCCDVMFYKYNDQDKTYVQQYEGFGVETFIFPETAIFPLDQIEFEGSMYPCPTHLKEYLEIQYGYIGEGAYWDPDINRWAKN